MRQGRELGFLLGMVGAVRAFEQGRARARCQVGKITPDPHPGRMEAGRPGRRCWSLVLV